LECEIVCNSLLVDPSTSVAVTVTSLPDRETAAMPAPVNVHAPPLLDSVLVTVVVPVKEIVCNSFDTLPSTSVAVIVISVPDLEAVAMPAPVIEKLPPLFDKVMTGVVVPLPDNVCISFDIDPSTSVPVIVMVEPATPTVLIPAPAMVIEPPLLDNVVIPVVVPLTEMVCSSLLTDPSTSVEVTVKASPVRDKVVIPAPVIENDPPELDKVTVGVDVPEVEMVCSSLVVEPSTSVAVAVIVFPVLEKARMPPELNVIVPPLNDKSIVGEVDPPADKV
jgi:hypothetical protein